MLLFDVNYCSSSGVAWERGSGERQKGISDGEQLRFEIQTWLPLKPVSLKRVQISGACVNYLLRIFWSLFVEPEALSCIVPRTFLRGFMDQGHLVPEALCLLV